MRRSASIARRSTPRPSSRSSTSKPNGKPQVVLNFITPHQKWGIHSTYTDNLLMLTLSRGGPVVWLSARSTPRKRHRRQRLGRGLQHQRGAGRPGGRVPAHQGGHDLHVSRAGEDRECAGLGTNRQRGGIHNSVTRAIVKPTHMIGGYAQQSYGFNYYGTVGSNRDEFVIVRKMEKVDWLDRPANPAPDQRPLEAAE